MLPRTTSLVRRRTASFAFRLSFDARCLAPKVYYGSYLMIMKYMCTAVDGSLKKFLKVYYGCQPHPDNSPKLALKRDYSSVSLLEGFLKIPRPLSCGRGQAARRLLSFCNRRDARVRVLSRCNSRPRNGFRVSRLARDEAL